MYVIAYASSSTEHRVRCSVLDIGKSGQARDAVDPGRDPGGRDLTGVSLRAQSSARKAGTCQRRSPQGLELRKPPSKLIQMKRLFLDDS